MMFCSTELPGIETPSAQLWAGAYRLPELLGSAAAEVIAQELGVNTVFGLLSYVPRKYYRSGASGDSKYISEGDRITIVGTISAIEYPKGIPMQSGKPAPYALGRMKFFRLIVKDASRKYSVTFFNPRKLLHFFSTGQRIVLDGTVSFFRREMQLAHPEWLLLPDGAHEGDRLPIDQLVGSRKLLGTAAAGSDALTVGHFFRPIIPLYSATKVLTSWEIWGYIRTVLRWVTQINMPDPLSEGVRTDVGVPSLVSAWHAVHEPEDLNQVEQAKRRIALDEALAIQLALQQRALREKLPHPSPVMLPTKDGLRHEFMAALPFELTQGQKAILKDIDADLAESIPMNRLLQGEVGSGKTIVALIAMLTAIDAGYQCCFLAPTEVLAAQHYRTFTAQLGDLARAGELGSSSKATTVTLLTGSMTVSQKKRAMLDIVSGQTGIVVGTHALLSEKVEFFKLGFIIIDEQHRFGVAQRNALQSKTSDHSVHTLVMTATPIPRTVALTRYGDLQVSELTELPRGRTPIKTSVVPWKTHPQWWDRAIVRMGEELRLGRQVYCVCPQITSENSGSITDQFNTIEPLAVEGFYEAFVAQYAHGFPGENSSEQGESSSTVSIGMLHGKLTAEEKARIMDQFNAGEIQVIIATTVIEVGVDVPNATMMVILDADRFGVSQLHQLRGRVGRGSAPGLCLLVTRLPPGTSAMARLDAVARTRDGRELALVDLAQRREGDVLGTKQSGFLSSFKVLSLFDDEDLIAYSHAYVAEILAAARESDRDFLSAYTALIGSEKLEYLDKA